MKKKRILGINIATMIMDIIMTLMSITALAQVFAEAPSFIIFGMVTFILHIISTVSCRKHGLSNSANVLGFVADGLLVFSLGILALPAFIIYIIAACKALNPPTVEFE